MASTTRQNSLLVNQDWTRIYDSFRNADFQSYDFQTLRKSMIDYLRVYYPEDFNDFIESSEYIALIDLVAFLGQSLAFRTDLNARENFIDTAERRDSVLKLARLISYNPKRNQTPTGFLKFNSVQTSEALTDSAGADLSYSTVKWNDSINLNWYEQFVTILNAALLTNQSIGKPSNSSTIAGVKNSEYQLNLASSSLPIFGFTAQVEGTPLPFEITSATSKDASYIYEVAPTVGKPLNILYKNDNLGNASNDTGFFFYFKQGNMQNIDFNFTESIPNNTVNVPFNNINNTDVWLYELNSNGTVKANWTPIPSVSGVNIIYNNNAAKKSFQVNTKNGDQIDLVFGDGTFSAIPQGNFRCYFRTSTGLSYNITPDEMQNLVFNIPYTSRNGRTETLTISASLKYTVTNATARETIDEIRTKAPQQYYTQDRMITAEDYNTFPYSNFNTVSKIKAVNRSSAGISRYLDVVDATGRYSSTNIFCADGVLYKDTSSDNLTFTWDTATDIAKVIVNQITPAIQKKELQHFYYANYARFALDLTWVQVTAGSGSCTGYFTTSDGTLTPVGEVGTGNTTYVTEGSIIELSPGTGNYFNAQSQIVTTPASGIPQNGTDKLYISVTNIVNGGVGTGSGTLSTGYGAVNLSDLVPTGALITKVIPAFSNSFSATAISNISTLVSAYTQFGVRYDQATATWVIVQERDLSTAAFSQANQGDTSGNALDSSWVLRFTTAGAGSSYNVEIRNLTYVFASLKETKFYYNGDAKIFDPITGLTVNDMVNVLKVNSDFNNSGNALAKDKPWAIYGQIIEEDGYADPSKVLVTYMDSNDDGVPDNPDIFNDIVSSTANTDTTRVFLKLVTGYDSYNSYQPIDPALVNTNYATQSAIEAAKALYTNGQVFYATTSGLFYTLTVSGSTYTISQATGYQVRTGRNGVYFQYKHNALNNRRIDPSSTNLIDLYLLTKNYETNFRSWALDTTGKVAKPSMPTSESLRIEFSMLDNYKAVSDTIVFNSAKFKPLFGSKAASALQATFKVVKNSNVTLSDSEIRSQVLAYINSFFATTNWDFGETFYFTELATYIQQGLAPNINSIIIVPNSAEQSYGSLQQISSNPDEILISVATVADIEVISSITAARLNIQNTTVNTIIN